MFAIAHFHQQDAYDNPYKFPHPGDEACIKPKGTGNGQSAGGKGEPSLARSHLKGREEENVGKQRGECHDEYAGGKADVCGKDIHYEIDFQTAHNPRQEFQSQRRIEGGPPLSVQFGNLLVHPL